LRELSRIAKYLLGTGIKEESVGTVVKYEAEHGITIKALRRYADDLVEMGVSRDQVGHVIEETAKHGTPASSLVQGLEMFLESAGNLKKEITLTVNVKGELKTIRVIMQGGNERSGLIHAYLRHVRGYEMEDAGITTFWPLGQKIIVNGRAKQLPKVFRNEEELVEFLKEVVERVSKNPEYVSEKFFKNGVPKTTVELEFPLEKFGIKIDGIDQIHLSFSFEDGEFVLKTAYPTKGWAVETFIPSRGGWQ